MDRFEDLKRFVVIGPDGAGVKVRAVFHSQPMEDYTIYQGQPLPGELWELLLNRQGAVDINDYEGALVRLHIADGEGTVAALRTSYLAVASVADGFAAHPEPSQ
ncbi:MAG TPA: hypothetical protein PLO23_09110 [Alphaproteobacteria bacterium]|nr:hypothetical protein [Alphaproteobacteria bacterium]